MIKATTNKRINGCGDVHLRDDQETWHDITITKVISNREVDAVTDCGVMVNLKLDSRRYSVCKPDKLTPIRYKDLKEFLL